MTKENHIITKKCVAMHTNYSLHFKQLYTIYCKSFEAEKFCGWTS